MEQGEEKQLPAVPRTVFVSDQVVAEHINTMLVAGGIHVDMDIIKLIMRYQSNHYENIGVIKIKYK